MYMRTWLEKIDEFLKMTGNDILTHRGKVSHVQAIDKAHNEYKKYKLLTQNELSKVEKDFIEYFSAVTQNLKGKN